jgi:hypothetical protein
MASLYAIGDIHGQYTKLVRLLQAHQLINAELQWVGGDAQLVLLGDFVDRGEDGIGVIELVMRLQREATDAGGSVQAVLGNHDVLFLTVNWFAERTTLDLSCKEFWLENGGQLSDLERLQPAHIIWLQQLPAMLRIRDKLVVHADAQFYYHYGSTLDEVNTTFAQMLHQPDYDELDLLLERFAQRVAFWDIHPAALDRARKFLDTYGGRQIWHGHTPIGKITGEADERIAAPLVYCQGLAVNLDGGMYLGGAGFVYQVP